MGNPQSGVMFHSGAGQHMDFDKLGQNIIRPAVEALRLKWHGWHGFRRGIASNLYELGANDKVVQRILRHAKPHVTKESGSFGCHEEPRNVFGHAERLFSNCSASELSNRGKLLKARRGEVAERLNAAVC
jgi:hypothetical protein